MNNDMDRRAEVKHRKQEARGMLTMLIEHVIHLDTPTV